MGVKELAATFGIHRATVSDYLQKQGVRVHRGLDEQHIPEAARLYAAGWSSRMLATKYGVSPNTVLRDARVHIRSANGRR